MKYRNRTGMVAGLLVLAFAPAVAQAAGAPAAVNLRVQGLAHSFPRTALTTTTTPVVIDGHDCPGTTDGGALVQGIGRSNLAAHWDSTFSTFSLDSVYGEALGFSSPAFWAILVDGQPNFGLCTSELSAGAEVIYYAACNTYYSGTPGPCYGDPLQISGVPSTIKPGVAFTVKVNEATIDPNANTATYAPSAGATVTAGGATATTGADGTATLAVSDRGSLTVTAAKGNRLDDSRPTCSTDGADGTCGTTKATTTTAAPVVTATGPDRVAPASVLKGLVEGKKYRASSAPRELKGTAADPSGILMVKLRITRNDKGKCSYFSGKSLRFRKMACGAAHGSWFKIGTSADWSYLLPQKLPRGRYVLDVNAIDKQYNRDDRRRRGGNRVVFTVA